MTSSASLVKRNAWPSEYTSSLHARQKILDTALPLSLAGALFVGFSTSPCLSDSFLPPNCISYTPFSFLLPQGIMDEGGPAPLPPRAGIHFTDEQFEQFMRRITATGRDPAQEKENDPPLAHPTLNFDADAAVKIIKLWHDAPFDIPDDIVKLFNAGLNIPLSLLSVAAVRDYAVNARRSTFHPKMTGKLMEEFQSWHTRDDALPFEEWAQASNTLLHLWRSIRVAPEDEPADQDPIQLFLEHFIAVSSQVTSVNWPIFREYDKRIRRIIWAPRGEGVGLPFHIRAIHQPTLTAAEAWISERLPVTIKSTGLATSAWNEVVTASTSDALRRTRELASCKS
ncbi:hypothetical protein V8E36_005493 [Tilletia maclaganii]